MLSTLFIYCVTEPWSRCRDFESNKSMTLSTPQISKMSDGHRPRSVCNSGPHLCSVMAMKIKARDHPGRKPSENRPYYRLLQETGVIA